MHQVQDIPPMMGMISDYAMNRMTDSGMVRLPNPPRKCDTCRAKGSFKSWNEQGTEVIEYECNCDNQYRAAIELISRGIDGDYQRLNWYDLTDFDSEALQEISEYMTHHEAYIHQGIGLNIHGNPGTGKSLIAYLLTKRLILLGYDAYFSQHNAMLDNYKSGWKSKEAEDAFKEQYYKPKVLVIDDFGAEADGPAGRNRDETLLDQVLRRRASNNLVTILTTNLSPHTLDPKSAASRYDVRVRSLLAGKNIKIEVKGEDFRPRRLKKQMEEARLGISRPVVL